MQAWENRLVGAALATLHVCCPCRPALSDLCSPGVWWLARRSSLSGHERTFGSNLLKTDGASVREVVENVTLSAVCRPSLRKLGCPAAFLFCRSILSSVSQTCRLLQLSLAGRAVLSPPLSDSDLPRRCLPRSTPSLLCRCLACLLSS